MSTVADICRRALMRSRVYGPGEVPSAADMSDAVDQLNDMMFGWKAQGVDIGHEELEGNDTFVFVVPPLAAESDTITALASQGDWNASSNVPALATNMGTDGFWYRVTTAGSTVLNDVVSWAPDDYAVFVAAPGCSGQWLKGRSSRAFEGGVIAMLTLQLCNDHGKEPTAIIVREAARGWSQIQSCFIKPKFNCNIDNGLVFMPSRRFIPDGTLLG